MASEVESSPNNHSNSGNLNITMVFEFPNQPTLKRAFEKVEQVCSKYPDANVDVKVVFGD